MPSSVTASSEDNILREGEPRVYDNCDGLFYPTPPPPTSEQVFTTLRSEFGHFANEELGFASQHPLGKPVSHHKEQDPPYYVLLSTYHCYMILICLGHSRDFFRKRLKHSAYTHLQPRMYVRLSSSAVFVMVEADYFTSVPFTRVVFL